MTGAVAIGLPAPAGGTYTYLLPSGMALPARGTRVLAPFGRQTRIGFVLGEGDASRDGLRPIGEVIDEAPLVTPELLRFLEEAAAYYLVPVADFLKLAVSSTPWPDARSRVALTERGREALATEGLLPLDRGGRGDAGILRALPRDRAIAVSTLREKCPGVAVAQAVARLAGAALVTVVDLEERKARKLDHGEEPLPPSFHGEPPAPVRELHPDQGRAIASLVERLGRPLPGTVLLHGVTASGKTEVYVRLMKEALARGRGVVYLAPEIALSEALHGVVGAAVGPDVVVLHSALTDAQRRAALARLLSGEARAVLGPRSALFAPVRDPGLVIVDEEHEGSYKSHTHPRYHARDMAVLRGHLAGALVVLGSATPSIESYHSAQRGKYAMVSMPARIRGAPLPVVEVADVRAELLASGQPALLARPLLGALRGALAAGAQGLVLLNRRGYASQLLCRGCGQPVPCDRCSQSLTFHRELGRLVCHLCGASRRLPQRCPECRGDLLELRGAGTERVQAEIEEILPEARALRIDSDLTARQAARAFARFGSGECRILVGTQMIAKGHDFRNVSVVGVLQADALLGLPDFRGAERTFQLLTQVAGRAGRHGGAGRVILQCWNGEHYAIAAARAHDYGAFYEREIRARSAQLLPPKTGLAIVLASARDEDAARDLASRAAEDLRRFRPSVDVLGPAPPFRARIAADHRRQIVVRARQRRSVREALARSAQESRLAAPFGIRGARLSLDIDPVDLL